MPVGRRPRAALAAVTVGRPPSAPAKSWADNRGGIPGLGVNLKMKVTAGQLELDGSDSPAAAPRSVLAAQSLIQGLSLQVAFAPPS
jgi:hypothetical protein